MSVILTDVSKDYRTRHGFNRILKNISMQVGPGEKVGILGQNGAGKSTLIRVLSGTEQPTSGSVTRTMSVSWPLAFGGAFLGGLTGVDNVRFVCRLYGVDPEEKLEFVEDFAELGRYMREPVKSYSSGMRARLAFAASMAIDFDCYLIDEIVAVGDDRFQRKCEEELFQKRGDRALLIVSHSPDFVSRHCDRASVLSAGTLTNFPDVDRAYEFYASHQVQLQPHMVVPTGRAAAPAVDLSGEAMDGVIQCWMSGGAAELEPRLDEIGLAKANVLEAINFIGVLSRRYPLVAEAAVRYLEREWPTEPLVFITAGDFFCGRRQHRPGVEAYRWALKLDPDSYWASRNLATEFYNVGRYADAIPLFEKAAEVAPDQVSALELQMRAIDCRTWLDEPIPNVEVEFLENHHVTVVDRSVLALQDGSASRISVGGIARPAIDVNSIKCTLNVAGRTVEMSPSLARSSLRRLAAASGAQAFSFTVYAPVPAGFEAASLDLTFSGLPLAQERIAARAIVGSLEAGEELIDAARRTGAAHRPDVSALFYGRSAQEGGSTDIVAFAEDLISLGFYDEAEERLLDWHQRHSSSAADDERDAVVDLLCAELARSRLPGWRGQIDEVLKQARASSNSASILANLGHASANDGKLAKAAALYREASEHIGDRTLIHFARGIQSAQFADEFGSLATEDGHISGSPEKDVVHLFACDAHYFNRFAATLVRSSVAAAGDVKLMVHAHIVDPNDESLELAERLASEYPFRFTSGGAPDYIQSSDVRRAFYTCARYLIAPHLLREYRCPLVITETDALMNWSWRDVIDHVVEADADVGFLRSGLWNWVPWTKIPAGIFMFAPTQTALDWASKVARFIELVFERQGSGAADVWTVDQVALWLANLNAPSDAKTVHLPMYSMLTLATGDKTNVFDAA